MSLVPMKYYFAVWGNFTSVVSIYHSDGSVCVTHGGIEMGQGINTKVAQVASKFLAVPMEKISVRPSNSLITPNTTVTGASIGSEAVSYATMIACETLQSRLAPVRTQMKSSATWEEVVHEAHEQNIDLTAFHTYTRNDDVKPYFIWGATLAEVEIDVLTGERQVLRVDLLEDVGTSISPMVDVGQIEGAFVMGMGYWLNEEIKHDHLTGKLINNSTWTYKPPGPKDIPADFRIYFLKNAPNPVGVLQSKATGEPAMNMSVSVLFAIRDAVKSARLDVRPSTEYFSINLPATPENVFLACLNNVKDFHL